MATQITAKLLPRIGDEVIIDGLKSAKHHNGKTGTVAGFDGKLERYRVTLEEKEGSPSQSLGVKLANIAVREQSSSNHSLHVLIPCHIATQRRVLSFQRCVKSILYQVDSEFAVFVGLSGPSDYRQIALKILALLASKSPSQRWYVQNEDMEGRPQMEHLRHLLQASLHVNEDSLLTFVDNDDMCHPLRFHCMQDAYQSIDPLPEPYTLAIPCKLLLNPSLTPAESQWENFVDVREPMDFDAWKKNSFAAEKVTLARNSKCEDLDCHEYFDFIVPSSVLQKFFDLTPVAVGSHKFCDLRLFQVLSLLSPFELEDNHPQMWLLAHYKIPMKDKWDAFDNHGQQSVDAIHSVDQLSATRVEKTTAADEALSERFCVISPPQVAICRDHIESFIIQYCGWNNTMLEKVKQLKTAELNESHGAGFGDAMWEECHASILSLFDDATLLGSEEVWKRQEKTQ